MTSKTKALFYYGHSVDDTNYTLDIKEGSTVIEIDVNIGGYSLSEFIQEISDQLNNYGGQAYTVSLDRTTRLITISAPTAFELLVTSGRAASLFPLIGFTGADRTGLSSYTGDTASGSEWRPQNIPTEYVPKEHNEELISPSINESANGEIEALTFGERRFIELNQTLITNKSQQASYFLDNNPTAISEAIEFLKYVKTKKRFEFMEDRDDPDTFDVVLLESSDGYSSGTGFKLKKMFSEGVAPYYQTGRFKLRVIE